MYSILKNRYFTVLIASVLLSINFLQAQTNVSSNITTNTTWTLINSPYIVKSNILVNSGITLNIEPGVVVKFDDNVGIVVNGKIIGDGTPTNSIIFTSSNITPNAGDWAAIRLSTSASPSIWDGSKNYLSGSKFSYCKFEYAGNSAIYSEVSLYVNNSIFINNKTITFSIVYDYIRTYSRNRRYKIIYSTIIIIFTRGYRLFYSWFYLT